ncbi:hypothetical protein E5161_02945 [Cohnella pontilimi]|uniref:DUF3939 domain-containing protein n=1 Tax=Cohnella pontilimi TaxID=2564100 RepID=A0A4U0FHB3_9BACL|nr:hypothetical protein [Cohnella pontilimi]TJY44355.1 hypothetical protein E5161_02945 [Cohnella pontilimi]
MNRKRTLLLALCTMILLLISGCLYPKDQTPGQDASAREAVLTVQDAVNRYKESTGLLPIQNAEASVPVYEKYRIDFGKLKRMGYLSAIPPAAFENGGGYIFLIIDEETDPQVKLLDLKVYQGITAMQSKVDDYRSAHGGSNPAAEEAFPGYLDLDYDKLGASRPDLSSMYSHRPLELMLSGDGEVFADYAADIAAAVQKTGAAPKPDEDLRHRLAEASYYVPVKAPVYRWQGEEPRPVAP